MIPWGGLKVLFASVFRKASQELLFMAYIFAIEKQKIKRNCCKRKKSSDWLAIF